MLRKFKLGGVILGALLALVGCQSEKLVNDGGSQQGQQFTLTASRGIQSRTNLGTEKNTLQLRWSAGDQIYVSSKDGKTTGVLTIKEGDENKPSATFSGFVFGDPKDLYYSVYPVPEDGKIELTEIVGNEYKIPMVGEISSNSVQFESTCGIASMNDLDSEVAVTMELNAGTSASSLISLAGVAEIDQEKLQKGEIALKYSAHPIKKSIKLENVKPIGGQLYFVYDLQNNKDKEKIHFYEDNSTEPISNATVSFKDASPSVILNTGVAISINANGDINKSENKEVESDGTVKIESDEPVVVVPKVESETVNIIMPTTLDNEEKAVVAINEVSNNNAVITIASESEEEKSQIEKMTVILPSSTTAAQVAQQVVIDMPNTTVTVKSADGNILIINEMTASTAENTLVVGADVEIKSLTIEQGNVQVFGHIGHLKRTTNDAVIDVVIEVGGSITKIDEGFNVVNKNNLPEGETIIIRNPELSTILKEVLGADKVSLNKQGYAVMLKSDVEEVKTLNFGIMVGNNKNLPSLAGIEHFVNLEEFYFRNEGSSLKEIDFSQNVNLKNLQLVFANPAVLDLSKNVNLESLLLVHMHVNNLDLSKNVKLKSLNVSECHLTTLDITSLPLLEDLYCNNQLNETFSQGINLTVVMTQAQMERWNSSWKENNKDRVYAVLSKMAYLEALSNSIIGAQQSPHEAERIAVYNWASAARISGEHSNYLSVGRYSDSYNSDYHNSYITKWIDNVNLAIALADNTLASFVNEHDRKFNQNLKSFARIWRAVMIAEYTDNFGPYPLNGFNDENTVFNSVQEVYFYMLDELKQAVANIDQTITPLAEEAALDPIFGFDAQKWVRYGNSLRLRLAMRLSVVDPVKARSEFESVDKNLLISSMNDIARVQEKNQYNAWAGIYSRSWNYISLPSTMSNILVGLGGVAVSEQRPDLAQYTKPMNYLGLQFLDHYADKTDNPTKGYWMDGIPENLDPRALRIYCIPGDTNADNFKDYGSANINNTNQPLNDENGKTMVNLQGQFTWNYYPAGSRSAWSPKFAKNYAVCSWYDTMLPVLCRTYGGDSEGARVWFGPWETHFLLAEAALYGWNTGTTAQAAYEQGIRTSFENFGVSQYVDEYLQSEDYNRIGVSVKFSHTTEPTNFTANYVNGYNNEAGTITYEYPNASKSLYKYGLNTQLAKIITQKYIAQAPYCTLEMWNDRRRLGLPWFDLPNNETTFVGTDMENTWTPTTYQIGQNTSVFPQRLRYPSGLKNMNGALQLLGGDNTTLTPLWWAMRDYGSTGQTNGAGANDFPIGGIY